MKIFGGKIMKRVHTEIYMGKTIEVFYNVNYSHYFVKIDGNILVPRGGGVTSGEYHDMKKAIMSAKVSIRKNTAKTNEVANIEREIAALQARLEALRNS
jgi:hypothetical protein